MIVHTRISQAAARRNFRRYLAGKIKPDVLGTLHAKIQATPRSMFSIAARISRDKFIALKSAI